MTVFFSLQHVVHVMSWVVLCLKGKLDICVDMISFIDGVFEREMIRKINYCCMLALYVVRAGNVTWCGSCVQLPYWPRWRLLRKLEFAISSWGVLHFLLSCMSDCTFISTVSLQITITIDCKTCRTRQVMNDKASLVNRTQTASDASKRSKSHTL